MMKKALMLCLSLMMVVGFAVGCGPPEIEGETGGEMVRALVGSPDYMNPILYTDSASADVLNYMFDGMMRRDHEFELVGHLAEDWDISDCDTEITFYLRDDVQWHDGEDFTAADVEYTFATMMHPDYPGVRGSNFEVLEEIKIIDDYEIKFIAEEPFGPLLNNLGFSIIPKHIFSDYEVAEIGDAHENRDDVIGTGPYVWGEWRDGEYIVLERNDNYWLDEEMPFIESIRFIDVQDIQAAMLALEQGEINYGSVNAEYLDDITSAKGPEGDGTLKFEELDDLGYTFLGFNHREDAFGEDKINPFSDVKVRRAITHGFDRDGIIEDLLQGQGYLMHSHFPRASWAYSEDGLTQYDYNPERAMELLEEAGWVEHEDYDYRVKEVAEGEFQEFEFELMTTRNNTRVQMATVAQQQLGEIGIGVDVELVEWQAYLNNHALVGDFEAIILGWSLGSDPDPYNIFHSSSIDGGFNFVGYENEEVDYFIMKGRRLVDEAERREAYAEVQKLMSEDLPYCFLFASKITHAVDTNLEGYKVGDSALYYPERWYYEEGVSALD